MPAYDPDQDIPYGIAGTAFPITFYDRPQYMFANLLRGDVDAATRAMLSPDTLTPSQIKSVRDILLPSKGKQNPLIKTITDIATNPFVIVGLILGLKYPLGTTNPLLVLRKGLMPKAATMGKLMSGLHGALENLRTIPHLYESMFGVTKATGDFVAKYGDDANAIFLKAGKVSKAEGAAVAAYLDGLHKADHYLVKSLGKEPEWIAFMGGSDVAVAPGLRQAMNSNLIGMADRLRGWLNKIRGIVTADPDSTARKIRALEKKGLQYGEDVVDYFPRHGQYNKYYRNSVRSLSGVEWRNWMHEAERVGKEDIARTGGMIPAYASSGILEEAGYVKPGFTDMVKSIYARRAADATSAVKGIWDDVAKLGLNESAERAEVVRRIGEYYTTGAGSKLDYLHRLGSPKQMEETLDAMAAALQDARFKGAEGVTKELADIGSVLAEPAQYALNPWEATATYLSSVASTHAWYGTGLGDKIMGIVKQPGVFRNAPYLKTYVMDNLIPHVQGYKSYQEVQRDLSFLVPKQKIYDWIKASPFVEGTIGTKGKTWLMDYFGKPSSFTSEGISAKISQGFHLSTLGANIPAASKNSLQNFVVTMTAQGIGPQGIWRGLWGVGGEEGALIKMKRYLKDVGRGIKTDVAFRSAFPEYVADMGEASNIVESLLAGDVAKEGYVKLIGKGGIWEEIKRGLMFPFSTSEAFNRIVGYYAGRNSHIFHNLRRLKDATPDVRNAIFKEAGEVGSTLTMLTHFTGGPLGVPKAIMNWPSPARQFMHFPLRYAGYLTGSVRMGPDPSKLDWGTIGRTMVGSTSAYLAAKNLLGIDLSAGLATGALPVPVYEQSPFYPWPLVPPIAGVAGGFAQALLSGSAEGLGSTAAMLVPGGISARRMYRGLSPKYADYDNRTPDGRIPVYNDDHALIGSFTPMQLILRAVGITSTDVAGESGAAKWLVAQRNRIREYRREWLQAMYENDFRKADNINKRFQKDYPELGPMEVKKSDIKALENRRETTRLHRILRGMPRAYKPLFSQVINEAAIGRAAQDIEMGGMGGLSTYSF